MKIFQFLIVLFILKLANARLLKSVFLASFDPLSIDNGLNESSSKSRDVTQEKQKSEISIDDQGGKIEFVNPISSEDAEIQQLATEFFLVLKELKELTKEEANAILNILPGN